MESERHVSFSEHVFLDRHLAAFPRHASVQHFMSLVCAGMSNNAYMTVEEKLEHIEWFRDYFRERDAAGDFEVDDDDDEAAATESG